MGDEEKSALLALLEKQLARNYEGLNNRGSPSSLFSRLSGRDLDDPKTSA